MLQDALPWSEAIVFSNLQPDFKDEHQISKSIPSDIAKGLVKVFYLMLSFVQVVSNRPHVGLKFSCVTVSMFCSMFSITIFGISAADLCE